MAGAARGSTMRRVHNPAKRGARVSRDSRSAQTINKMVWRIVEYLRPDRVFLFGSYATGLQGPDSDVDLLVVAQIEGPKRPKEVELHRLLAGIGLPKDIVVVTPDEVEEYRRVRGTIIESALRQGKVLYERSP